MLDTAAQYRYCTPYANGIRGSILPLVEGTASGGVNRHEDIAFLTEALRERYDWCVGRPNGSVLYAGIAPSYETSGLVGVRQAVSELAKAVRNMPVIGASPHSPPPASGGLLPADWSYSGRYPVVSFSPAGAPSYPPHADAVWLDGVDIDFACDGYGTYRGNVVVPRVFEGGTLRDIYADTFDMKRFMWRVVEPDFTNQPFYDGVANASFGRHFVTFLSYSDTVYSPNPTMPYGDYTNNGGPNDGYFVHPATLALYIRKPFRVDDYASRAYYSSLSAYGVFRFYVVYADGGSDYNEMLVPLGSFQPSGNSTSHFSGAVTMNFTESLMKDYIDLTRLELTQRHGVSGITFLRLTLERLYFDTGTIALPSTLPQVGD